MGNPRVFSKMANELAGSDIIRLAWEINARKQKGEEIFNMTIGDFNPDFFPIPNAMKDMICQAYQTRKTNYPQSEGLPELRNAISRFLKRNGDFEVKPEEIQIASGARPLVYATFQTLLDPGETVIYGVPSWNNEHFVFLSGAKGVKINSGPENHFLPTAQLLSTHLPEATLISLCSPLNPSGTIYSATQLKEICLAIWEENQKRIKSQQKPVYLLFDQIYWRLCFGSNQHVHPVALVPELKDYTIYIDGVSKAFSATGVRLGWAFGPGDIIEKMKHFLGHVGAWAAKPEQMGIAGFLDSQKDEEDYHSWINDEISNRLSKIYDGLIRFSSEGLSVNAIEPQGALYLSVCFPLIGKKHKQVTFKTTEDILAFLLNEAGLAVVPFKSFGVDNCPDWFRISVGSCSKEDIPRLLSRLKNALLLIE